MVRYLLHWFWLAVISHRNCSIHWFFHSESLSVWGCAVDKRFQLMPSSFPIAFPKWDVNRGSQSEMICLGRPNHL
jgi:hypothetical protein